MIIERSLNPVVVWLKRDLRLSDHSALALCLAVVRRHKSASAQPLRGMP
ncbi:hypothetical protein [Marinomonas rhizomae]|nr:hypothetical protein [Marinomonas rhizomae]